MDTFTLTADTAQTISALYKQAADPQPIEEICLVVNELIKNSENAILWLKNIERDITRRHRITIAFNRTKRTITVTDTGIGMNKSELISFLGIIGKSGTRTYRDNTPDTIPFQGSCEGVGFYSVFLIAAKVQVYSKSEDSVHVWEWKREKNFTIDTADPSCLERGTRVIVYLKDDLLVENVETIAAKILADRDENRKSLLSFDFDTADPQPVPDVAPVIDPHAALRSLSISNAYQSLIDLPIESYETALTQNADGDTALHVLLSFQEPVEALLSTGLAALIQSRESDDATSILSLKNNAGKNPLHLAVESGNRDFLRPFLSDPRFSNYVNETVGIEAATTQDVEDNEEEGSNPRWRFLHRHLFFPIQKAARMISEEESKHCKRKAEGRDLELLKLCPDFGCNLLHLALKRGEADMITLLRENNRFQLTSDKLGNTPAHLVAMSGNMDLFETLRGNVHNFFDVANWRHYRNKAGDTVLHTAADSGHDKFVVYFLSIGIALESRNNRKLTPLHCAARSGKNKTVALLVSVFHANVNAKTSKNVTPLFLAAKFHNFELMKYLLTWGANANAVNRAQSNPLKGAIEKMVNKSEMISVVRYLIQCGANIFIDSTEPKVAIKILGWVADFPIYNHKDASHESPHQSRMPFAMITLLKFHPNPTTFLNSHMENLLFRLHETECGPQLIGQLLLFSIAIKEAMDTHPLEEIYLQKHFDDIDDIIVKCMESPSMDDPKKFITMMCTNPFNGKLPSQRFLHETVEGKITSDAKRFMFTQGPLRLCMDYRLSAFSGTLQVASISNIAFRDHMKDKYNTSFLETLSNIPSSSTTARRRMSDNGGPQINDNTGSRSEEEEVILDMRSKPILMFFLEGLSKAILLLLCAFISIHVYQDTNNFDHRSDFYPSERWLIILWVSFTLHELGQMYDTLWDWRQYFGWVWNKLDWATIFLVFLWLICRKGTSDSFLVAKCALSLASIPGSLNLLRYLSLHKSSGVLVITIMRLGFDLSDFLLVFVFGVVGFGIALMGLFSDHHADYPNIKETFYTLLSSGLGNFDLTTLGGPYKDVGKLLLICYVIFAAVLLVNLLIARMADTYTKIDNRAFQEWSLTLAKNADNFMLLKERSTLSMLPPPLNLIPASLSVFHWLWCEKAIYEGKRETYRTRDQIIQIAFNLNRGPLPEVDLGARPSFLGETFTISYIGTISDGIVNMLCFPVFLFFLLVVRSANFVAKLWKAEGWKASYISIMGVPWVLALSFVRGWGILLRSLGRATVLKLDPYGQVARLDVEHEEGVEPGRPWYQFNLPNRMTCSLRRPRIPLLRNPSDPPDLQPLADGATREVHFLDWFLMPQIWTRPCTDIQTYDRDETSDQAGPRRVEEWFNADELRRIFKDHISSRYPPNSSAVDDVMNGNIKNIMSKMRFLQTRAPPTTPHDPQGTTTPHAPHGTPTTPHAAQDTTPTPRSPLDNFLSRPSGRNLNPIVASMPNAGTHG